MSISPLIILFGEKLSVKQLICEQLLQFTSHSDLLEYLLPKSALVNDQKEQLWILNTPNFDKIDEISHWYSALVDIQSEYKYKIVQLIFCLNGEREQDQQIEDILKSVREFGYTYNKIGVTFLINNIDSWQIQEISKNFMNKWKANARFITMTEQNQMKEIERWQTKTWNEYFDGYFYKFGNGRSSNTSLVQMTLIQRLIGELKTDKYPNVNQFLNFVESSRELEEIFQKQRLSKDQQYSEISLHLELYRMHKQLNELIDSELNIIKTKLVQQKNYFNNCTYCSSCENYFTLQKHFFFKSAFRFASQNKTPQTVTKSCQKCKANTFPDKNNSHLCFVKTAIISKCIESYFDFLQQQKYQNINKAPLSNISSIEQKQFTENRKPEQQIIVENQQEVITALFLSNENDQKSFVFNTLNYQENLCEVMMEENNFRRSRILKDTFFCFQVVDSPCFSFTEDAEETTVVFKNYFSKHQIHFIFLFVDYQRTDLMKQKINQMLKKLIGVDKTKMVIVVTNCQVANCQQSSNKQDEVQFKEFSQSKNIQDVILISRGDKQFQLLEQFSKYLTNLDQNCLSFQETVFAKETEEELAQARNLTGQLNALKDKIRVDKLIQEKERLEKIRLDKQRLQDEWDGFEKELQSIQKKLKSTKMLYWEKDTEQKECQRQVWELEKEDNQQQGRFKPKQNNESYY